MEIAVFGATGRTGSAVLEHALARGHRVRALVRTPSKLTIRSPDLEVIEGDAFDAAAVARAVGDAGAVVSAMGAAGLEPTTDLSTMTGNVITAVSARADAPRLSVVLNDHVFHSEDAAPPYTHIVREHKRNLEALRASDSAWVGACPAYIRDEDGTGAYEAVIDAPAHARSISRLDLADFLIDAVETDAFVGHAVGVGASPAAGAERGANL